MGSLTTEFCGAAPAAVQSFFRWLEGASYATNVSSAVVHLGQAARIAINSRIVASLDRKRLGKKVSNEDELERGVFDKEARRKPLAFAADAV